MRFIVVGAGATGFHIASRLAKSDNEVVVIERSQQQAEYVEQQLDVGVVLGNGVNPKILKEAGVDGAHFLVATTGSDDTNIIICSLAKELNVERNLARVRNSEYFGYFTMEYPSKNIKVERPVRLGVDDIVNPEEETATQIEICLSSQYVSNSQYLASHMVQIRSFKVENPSMFNRTTGYIKKEILPKPCGVILLTKASGFILPDEEEVVEQGDYVYLLSATEDMEKLATKFNHTKLDINRVAILGGGNIGFQVADILDKRGIQVKLIEKDKARSEEISAKLRKVEVLNSVGTDEEFLKEEGIPSSDVFISATGDESLNILVGLLAKKLGVPKCIVVVDKPEYVTLAESIGVDIALSPPIAAGNKAVNIALKGNAVSSLAMLEDEQVQVVEFVVKDKSKLISSSIGSMRLPKSTNVAAILRDNKLIFDPSDEEKLYYRDHVIVISNSTNFPRVEKLFNDEK
jgi:trk system potassium uptake protein